MIRIPYLNPQPTLEKRHGQGIKLRVNRSVGNPSNASLAMKGLVPHRALQYAMVIHVSTDHSPKFMTHGHTRGRERPQSFVQGRKKWSKNSPEPCNTVTHKSLPRRDSRVLNRTLGPAESNSVMLKNFGDTFWRKLAGP